MHLVTSTYSKRPRMRKRSAAKWRRYFVGNEASSVTCHRVNQKVAVHGHWTGAGWRSRVHAYSFVAYAYSPSGERGAGWNEGNTRAGVYERHIYTSCSQPGPRERLLRKRCGHDRGWDRAGLGGEGWELRRRRGILNGLERNPLWKCPWKPNAGHCEREKERDREIREPTIAQVVQNCIRMNQAIRKSARFLGTTSIDIDVRAIEGKPL